MKKVRKLVADEPKRRAKKKSQDSELKALRKLVDQQAETIDRLRHTNKAKVPKASRRKGSKSFVRVIFSDVHGEHHNPEAVAAFLSDLDALKPKEVVCLGDLLDCGGFLSQHKTLGVVAELEVTYEQDVAAANMVLDEVQQRAPGAPLTLIGGNHECLEPGTEVLTAEGWVPIYAVTREHSVAQLDEDGSAVFDHPTHIVSGEYSGYLVVMHARGGCLPMTPNHRIAYQTQRGAGILYRRADTLLGSGGSSRVLVSGLNSRPDLEMSDVEIQIAAWILTDGSTGRYPVIYQSKEPHVSNIRSLLQACGLPYEGKVRRRPPPEEICGSKVKSALPATEFHLGKEGAKFVKRLGLRKGEMPEWAFLLSARQFGLFFQTMIDADASVQPGYKSGALYGRRDWLCEVQRLTSVNGVRTSLRERTTPAGSHWVLNFSFRDSVQVEHSSTTLKPFSGTVYCLATRTSNFIVRYEGTVYVTGNSRVSRWINDQVLGNARNAAYLERMIGPRSVLNLDKRGIRFIERHKKYDGLSITGACRLEPQAVATHGEQACGKYATFRLLDRLGTSVFSGHAHRLDCVYQERLDGHIVGVHTGCLCDLRPLYMLTRTTDWTHGYAVQIVQPGRGFLTFCVPIVDGVSFLQPLARLMNV